MRILVIEDDPDIRSAVDSALRSDGFAVDTAADLADADLLLSVNQYDTVVADRMVPDGDSTTLVAALRQDGQGVPVLFLTARTDTSDRVRGLTAGGDDYIVKPFALEELLARVHGALRRSQDRGATARFQVGDLVLDDAAHRVWRGDDEVMLSATEFKLLRCLMSNAGRVVSRGQILDHVWHYDFDGESTIVESFISNVRKKVDQDPKLIHTVRGIGYVIREPS